VDHRRPELSKRQKEITRLKKQQEKQERRSQRQRERDQRLSAAGPDEDPDIAGIVPGPQPPPLEE
jgi:hypothetical protein